MYCRSTVSCNKLRSTRVDYYHHLSIYFMKIKNMVMLRKRTKIIELTET